MSEKIETSELDVFKRQFKGLTDIRLHHELSNKVDLLISKEEVKKIRNDLSQQIFDLSQKFSTDNVVTRDDMMKEIIKLERAQKSVNDQKSIKQVCEKHHFEFANKIEALKDDTVELKKKINNFDYMFGIFRNQVETLYELKKDSNSLREKVELMATADEIKTNTELFQTSIKTFKLDIEKFTKSNHETQEIIKNFEFVLCEKANKVALLD